jgi:hypothetical protein
MAWDSSLHFTCWYCTRYTVLCNPPPPPTPLVQNEKELIQNWRFWSSQQDHSGGPTMQANPEVAAENWGRNDRSTQQSWRDNQNREWGIKFYSKSFPSVHQENAAEKSRHAWLISKVFFTEVRGAASNFAYGYPKLWIKRYPAQSVSLLHNVCHNPGTLQNCLSHYFVYHTIADPLPARLIFILLI